MTIIHGAPSLIVTALLLLASFHAPALQNLGDEDPSINSRFQDNVPTVDAQEGTVRNEHSAPNTDVASGGRAGSGTAASNQETYHTASRDCGWIVEDPTGAPGETYFCADGVSDALDPTLYRITNPRNGEVVSTPEDPIPIIVTYRDLASLPLNSGSVEVQPAASEVLIGVDTIAYSTVAEHTLAVTLLGVPVEIHAVPVEWSWDFGGGTVPFTTAEPGQPYPNYTVAATYTHVLPEVAVSVAITWEGEFRVDGGPWLPIIGTATTTATSAPFATQEAPTHLVSGPLDG